MEGTRQVFELRGPNGSFSIPTLNKHKYFKIEQVVIPHIWDYIPAGFINFVDSLGAAHVINYPSLHPSMSDIGQLALILGTFDTGGATYSVTINNAFTTWTLSSNGGTFFSLDFDQWYGQHLGITGNITGNRYGYINVTTFTTQKFYMGTQFINIRTNISSNAKTMSYDNLTGPSEPPIVEMRSSDYVISVPVKSQINELETFYLGNVSPDFQYGANPTQINFYLTDEYGLPLDVSPQRWYITIISYDITFEKVSKAC